MALLLVGDLLSSSPIESMIDESVGDPSLHDCSSGVDWRHLGRMRWGRSGGVHFVEINCTIFTK